MSARLLKGGHQPSGSSEGRPPLPKTGSAVSDVRQEAVDRVRRDGIFAIAEALDRGTPADEIAAAIERVDQGMNALRSGRLNDKALVLLISWASNVPQRDVKLVFDAMANLEKTYLKRKP